MGQSLLTSSGASDCPYNVGDIYITTLNTNPQDIWQNTTWEKIKDRFLLSSGDTYTLGATGGEATHTLSYDEMPKHDHGIAGAPATSPNGVIFGAWNGICADNTGGDGGRYWPLSMTKSGNNKPHNNMPPYLCVNMWIRKE